MMRNIGKKRGGRKAKPRFSQTGAKAIIFKPRGRTMAAGLFG